MSSAMRCIIRSVGVTALVVAVSGGVVPGAHAATSRPSNVSPQSTSLGCGYDGHVNSFATYNHCGRGSVVIEVDHLFWQHNYACMPPGVNTIPQGNISWAVIGAEADGNTCTWPYPISIVGP